MSPKNYGRQAEGKTIKSISIESDLADWIQEQAKAKGLTFSSFINNYFRERFESESSAKGSSKTLSTSAKKAHLMAAAGPGIMAEVIDWEGEGDTVSVKICGNSMFPLLNDGDVIDMTHKKSSRSPFMKKGLIYLVQLDGEWMVKRYDTRKAKPDEKGADYLTSHGTVGVLKSENPEFKDIDITGPCEWAAWLSE